MALFEDILEEALGPVAIGVAAVLLVPKLFPSVGRALRPAAKEVIKAGIAIYDRTAATVTEATGDLVAEARAELESDAHHHAARKSPASPAHG